MWINNWLNIALSLTVSEIFSMFYFPLKFKMATKSGKNWNFSPLQKMLLYYPMGQKFTRNHSIFYNSEIFTNFYFLLKSKMAARSGENWFFFPFAQDTLVLPRGSKILSKSLYLLVSEIFFIIIMFYFPLKSKMAAKSGKNSNFSLMHRTLLHRDVIVYRDIIISPMFQVRTRYRALFS